MDAFHESRVKMMQQSGEIFDHLSSSCGFVERWRISSSSASAGLFHQDREGDEIPIGGVAQWQTNKKREAIMSWDDHAGMIL